MNDLELRRMREKLEVLTGERGDKTRAAMTRGEADELRRSVAQAITDIAAIKTHLGL